MFKKCLFFTFVFAFFLVPHFVANQKADALYLNFGGRVTFTYYCLNGVIKTSSKNNTSSVIISENKDLDNDGIPDWLEQIVGTSEKNRHIQPNEIALREEKRFLGAVIASEIEKQGGAITSLGEKELAQIVSDSILRELKNTFPAIKISILPSDILDKNVFNSLNMESETICASSFLPMRLWHLLVFLSLMQ